MGFLPRMSVFICAMVLPEGVAFVYNKSVQLVSYFNHCLNNRVPSLWNSLPLIILKSATVASFRRNVRYWLTATDCSYFDGCVLFVFVP